MEIPSWVLDEIRKYQPPPTGKVVLNLEVYMGGVTSIEIGGVVRKKPPEKTKCGH